MTPSVSAETSQRRRVVVAGGGIGGLTAALALQQAGFAVTVLERAPDLGEVGAGIQISPNAWRVLDSLGVAAALNKTAVRPDSIRIHSVRTGGEIGRVPLGAVVEERFGAPYCVIHRGDLHAALAAAVAERPDIDVELDATVADASVDEDGVTVEFQGPDGVATVRGAALIGADGVWSAVRRRLLRLPSADYSGRVAYRATIPADTLHDLTGATGLWLGEKAHLVHYPIRAKTALNIVAVIEEDWHDETWSAPGDRNLLLERFAGWPQAARRVLEAPANWLKWALCDVGSGTIWTEGRIALLGDAAHAMLPFMAQGGAMAIEDAIVLADALREQDDIEAALLAYERKRKPRVERVMAMARSNARTYHMRGFKAALRDTGIRALSGERLLTRFDWLFGWQPR